MNDKPQETSTVLSEEEASKLLRSLLHKAGNWVDWGRACQQLQKAGYNAQSLFEQTGFQASQQNLIIVAAQVYDSLISGGVAAESLTYFLGPKSDILYEFRILNQAQRLQAAQLAQEKNIDVDEAKDFAKAIQEFSRLSQLPAGFSEQAGDAVAYQCWKRARQLKDLQQRSRLIAKGLKFAQSPTAREAIEKLLSDFTVIPTRNAPLLPLYRPESETALSRLVPVVGTLPLTKSDLAAVTALELVEPFGIAAYAGTGAIVALPGWQAILKVGDPVAILCQSDRFPNTLPGNPEEILVVIDRAACEWDINQYFVLEQLGELVFDWFEEAPTVPLLGQIVLVLRPKKIFDENNLLEPWQMDD